MKIQRRVRSGKNPKWVEGENKRKHHCDICGKKLWVAPDGKTVYCYCNEEMSKEEKNEFVDEKISTEAKENN